jgi:DNA-binding MarR family transcriptional regulator
MLESSPSNSPDVSPSSHLLAFELFNEVAIIDQLAQTQAAQLLAPTLNMPQFIVLNHLYRRDQSASMVSIANAIQVTKGAMTHTVTKLLQKNWVTSQADPNDGRGKLITLTAAGRQTRDAAVLKMSVHLSDIQRVLSDAEMLQMLPLLRKTRVWLDHQRDPSAQ